ncbi:hypothetical protein GMDG_08828 [Pseudogymnoascus destructans 20631-21]|uniref:Uncharacterized protein n=1 Tax=Pseudogymnoascus destructans (strain ATCC MYA-4855 / 20631-21) TaxID=658429 RepID=L8FNS9_PSED2|nr:hypothetical protein GMDG_08828 [Pseudogymnoascus destructans 20631-21]
MTIAIHGYGLRSQRIRHGGTSKNASIAGAKNTAVYFDSSARPPNNPAASHQRLSLLCVNRTSDQTIASENGISATSGRMRDANRPYSGATSGISTARTTAPRSRVTRQTISPRSATAIHIASNPPKRAPKLVSPKIAVPNRTTQAIIGG